MNGYLVASYAVTFLSLGGYWIYLIRERRRLTPGCNRKSG